MLRSGPFYVFHPCVPVPVSHRPFCRWVHAGQALDTLPSLLWTLGCLSHLYIFFLSCPPFSPKSILIKHTTPRPMVKWLIEKGFPYRSESSSNDYLRLKTWHKGEFQIVNITFTKRKIQSLVSHIFLDSSSIHMLTISANRQGDSSCILNGP